MKAALCLIGTELTRGIIQDSHTKLIASTLDGMGFDIAEVVIIPDDGTVGPLLKQLVAQVDVIICTGGLGPTSDDITRDAIAEAAGVELAEDKAALDELEAMIRRKAGNANRRQIMIPRGFKILKNPLGTAPGFYGTIEKALVFCIPGPPAEMERMFLREVLPVLSGSHDAYEAPLEISTFLIPESQLEELCIKAQQPGVSWGTRVQGLKISLYLRGGSDADRMRMVEQLQQEAGRGRVRIGEQELAERVIDLLRSRGMCTVFAESCTGGMAGKVFTDIPGSSDVFWGSFVTYANDAKEKMLSVNSSTLEKYGAVSEETVIEMAQGALMHSNADVACAVSGVAGPEGGTEEKPVGTVCFGLSGKGREPVAIQWKWGYPRRDLIRRRAVIMAFLLLEAYVKGEQVLDIVKDWQYS